MLPGRLQLRRSSPAPCAQRTGPASGPTSRPPCQLRKSQAGVTPVVQPHRLPQPPALQRLRCHGQAVHTQQTCTRLDDSQIAAAADAQSAQDLWQFPDRQNWYKAKFVADDAPDYQPATLVSTRQATAQVREVTLDIEMSRERIPLRNAYRHIGQTARVRLSSGLDYDVPVASPPFPLALNRLPLFLSRLDIYAGEIKTQKPEPTSVRANLSLLVPSGKRYEELYNLQEGAALEIGPFQGGGMPLRGPVRSIYSVPTIVIFCEGLGIATARALIEAEPSVGSLNFPLRQSVRLYYRAPNREAFLYQDRFAEWEEQGACTVVTSTRETFTEMFDNDDTLEYEPAATVAIVLTGQDEEAEEAALEACKEAEITEIVRGTEDDARTEMLEKGK